jgi:PAS domain S-box-containing protein
METAVGNSAAFSVREHLVQFYEDDEFLAGAVAKFLGEGVAAGDVLIVIATIAHLERFLRRLELDGFDVAGMRAFGQLIELDADQTLAKLMRAGEPDPALFEAEIGSLIATRAAAGTGQVRAYGEMVDILWRDGQRKAALRLEELWNDLQSRHSFRLLCAYAMASFYKQPAGLQCVCATHTHVLETNASNPEQMDASAIALPPAYAQRLAREIAQRAEVEQALRESLRDLRRREHELRRSEEQLKLITDAVPVLVAYIGCDQRYAFVSASYERWFGKPRSQLAGKHLEEVLGTAAYQTVRPHIEKALAGETVSYQAELPYASGGVRFVEATYVPQIAQDGSVPGLVAFVADATERKHLERFRTAAAERAERLLKITAALADAVTAEQVFEAVVDQVAHVIDASSVGLWLADEEGRAATLVRALGYVASSRREFETLPLESSRGIPIVDSIRSGQAIWIASPAELLNRYPHLAANVTPGRSYRVCCLPLIAHGRTLGALGITIEEAREAGAEERDFLLLVARYAGQALERLRLLDAERRSRAEADAAVTRMGILYQENLDARSRAEQLYRFAHVVVTADRLEQVFDAALDAIEVALGTPRAAILIFDDAGVMRFRAWRGLSDEYRRAVEGHSPWSRDAVAPEPVLVPDVEADETLAAYRQLFQGEGISSLAFIPLVTRGRLIGKFMVYYGEAHPYTSYELEIASALANHLASVAARFDAIAILEETIHYNDLFAGILAHDLRNPLSAIMTAAQLVLLRQEDDGAKNGKALGRIFTSGQRIMAMINQLLDVTRARAGGGIELQPCATNLAAICGQAIEEIELVYPEWNMHCEAHGDSDGSWDPDRLMQIFSNLITNAGQHGDPDGVISIRLDGRRSDVVSFEVHNQGVIPESLVPSLFDPFRGMRPRPSHSGGLGLGLFIVKELVRAHAGTVDVASSEEAGTTFTVRLPRRVTASVRARHAE